VTSGTGLKSMPECRCRTIRRRTSGKTNDAGLTFSPGVWYSGISCLKHHKNEEKIAYNLKGEGTRSSVLHLLYMTVFIINAANLAKLQSKASKIDDGNENLKRDFQAF
jgi:hypothetical protein